MKGFLSEEEKEVLKMIHREMMEKKLADRIKCILMLDEGVPYEEIRLFLLLDESTIWRNQEDYRKGGVNQLLEWNYKGSEGKLTTEQEEELRNHLREHLMKTAKEVVGWIQERFGVKYTPEGCVHVLHRLGFVYKQTKSVPSKADPEKQREFIQKYEELKKSLGEKDKIYFMDGVHVQHNSLPAYGWIEKGQEHEISANTGRQRINLNGALSVSASEPEVTVREDERINAASTVQLLKQIEQAHPEAQRMIVIADNAPYNRAKEVSEYLKQSKIEMLFLPTYSPNLNLIERVWKFAKGHLVRGKYYEKFGEFKNHVLSFFQNLAPYRESLKSLLTENFHIIGSNSS